MADTSTPPTTESILEASAKLGDALAAHPAVSKYKDAQKAVSTDPEAGRLLAEFEKELMQLSRLEAQGMEVGPAQQAKLQQLQARIVSNLRIKALNIAEVDFYDLLRKVNQTMLRPIGGGLAGGQPPAQPAQAAPTGPRIMGI